MVLQSVRRPATSRLRHADWRPRLLPLVAGSVLAGSVLACGGVADGGTLPPNVPDPTTLQTPAGAMLRYNGALGRLRLAFEGVLLRGALLTDELAALPTPLGQRGTFTEFDSRQNLEIRSDEPYNSLHMLRAQAREARGFLAAYAPDSSPALRAHMHALEGYAEILLADLFCSGVPLSTVDFDGDYTLAAGSSTQQIYEHAVALFDSATTLAVDSVRIQSLVAIGRGRALLSLGRFADAAAAVASVPSEYTYVVSVPSVIRVGIGNVPQLTGLTSFVSTYARVPAVPSVADREGANGLDYRSSGDPRTRTVRLGAGLFGGDMYYPDPNKFAQTGFVNFTLANGIEARLIEAEAALHAGGADWLVKLNALRTDGTFDTQPHPDDPNQTDTLWHAGAGRVAGLRPLDDPGSEELRVDLVFRERAFWLFLTGHRQGDLRRLVRQYFRAPDAVYPAGSYPGAEGVYGSELVVPVPVSERELNPMYSGCIHRDA